MKKFLFILSIILISSTAIKAQFYIGPFVGFKSSGLKALGQGSKIVFLEATIRLQMQARQVLMLVLQPGTRLTSRCCRRAL